MIDATEIAVMPAVELRRRYRAGELTPVEVVEALLDRIERIDGAVNAWCLVDRERALEAAHASAVRYRRGAPAGLLDGVPVAVKDVFLTRGWPTLKGSTLIEPDQRWDVDSPPVAALERHGAILLGKTTTSELGWKAVTDSPLHGVTRNPWDPSRTAGGSSGGSAAALAAGMVPLALGTDAGGSIRIPAAFCAVAGLKPTFGRVPHWPIGPFGTLAHAGPLARTVEDLALLFTVLNEPDPRDFHALPREPLRFDALLDGGLDGLRVALSPDLGFAEVDAEVRAAVEGAAEAFRELGAHVEPVAPGFDDPLDIWRVHWTVGAAAATRPFGPDARRRMDPGLVAILDEGARYSAVEYAEAGARRGDLATRVAALHGAWDLLLTPAVAIPPFAAGREVPPGWPHERWWTWAPMSYPFNLTQQPAASVPCGFTARGLPIGLQIVGPKHRDALVLRAARAYERAHPLWSFGRRWPIEPGETRVSTEGYS